MAGLFDPLSLRGLTLKNRIVMPPMVSINVADSGGEITRRHLEHYLRRARGGTGLILAEHTYVLPNGKIRGNQLGLDADGQVPRWRGLVEAVHEAGAAIGIQISHSGAKTQDLAAGVAPLGPSEVPALSGALIKGDMPKPRSATLAEIREIVAAFGQAARRAAEAGFDVVEVHGAHGYLLSQFASPLTNRRSDKYGGDLWGRFRLTLEVLQEIRRHLRSDIPLFCRYPAEDCLPGGLSLEDSCRMAPALLEAGADVLDVSGGLIGSGRDRFTQEGFFVEAARQIKAASGAVVVGVGNIRDPVYADRIVREGHVDLVAVGRAMLKDPAWAARAREALGQ